ncbi:MAG: helix-turn-helix transcriptional regulator [Gemmatimonadaceae bacterium]|nr:helix-turn-helix transcriptional regulator [Gloeobacterales cyanobacterium ES-bin-141]
MKLDPVYAVTNLDKLLEVTEVISTNIPSQQSQIPPRRIDFDDLCKVLERQWKIDKVRWKILDAIADNEGQETKLLSQLVNLSKTSFRHHARALVEETLVAIAEGISRGGAPPKLYSLEQDVDKETLRKAMTKVHLSIEQSAANVASRNTPRGRRRGLMADTKMHEVYDYLHKNGYFTKAQIQHNLNLTESIAYSALHRLNKANQLLFHPPGKGGGRGCLISVVGTTVSPPASLPNTSNGPSVHQPSQSPTTPQVPPAVPQPLQGTLNSHASGIPPVPPISPNPVQNGANGLSPDDRFQIVTDRVQKARKEFKECGQDMLKLEQELADLKVRHDALYSTLVAFESMPNI